MLMIMNLYQYRRLINVEIDRISESFVFMKVGQHAGEELDSILERKREEIKKTGMSFWGYGGPTCHPTKQVQPFAKYIVEKKGSIYLCMEKIKSFADPDIVPATMYSVDGINYTPIPEGITVTGSRYAIVLDEIIPEEFEIPIEAYEVACGKSMGKPASTYIQGHVDKACLEVNFNRMADITNKRKKISFIARMKEPYAVFVK